MKNLIFILIFLVCLSGYSQQSDTVIHVSEDIELLKLSENTYLHISYIDTEKWGRVPANGLIYIDKNKAFIFDTPWSDAQTEVLVTFIEDSLKLKLIGFIPNHWHEDCMGGLAYIQSKKIKSYANQMTIDIAKKHSLPIPDIGFNDSILLKLGNKKINCYYLGAAHTLDNIVVWLSEEQILFAGCILKGMKAQNIGFVGDGDINEYPNTLNKIITKFSDAKIVIPGHGAYGGIELINHNIDLVNKL